MLFFYANYFKLKLRQISKEVIAGLAYAEGESEKAFILRFPQSSWTLI